MHGRPQEGKHRRPPPPPGKTKIHIGALFSKWGPFFFIEALFRLVSLTKNYVGIHGIEQTRCQYCNKGNTNTWYIKCNIYLCFTETRNWYIALPYHIIIDVLDEDLLNDINNIFKCCT